jgi:hypothetical protein
LNVGLRSPEVLGRLLAPRRTKRVVTWPQFLRELEVLGLAGRTFGLFEYAAALAAYLGIFVEIERVRAVADPLARWEIDQQGLYGEVRRVAPRGDAYIFIPDHLPEHEWLFSLGHELGHVAGGHEVPADRVFGAPGSSELWAPPKALARRPVRGEALAEEDADRRAEFVLRAGQEGADAYSDAWFFEGGR